MNIIKAIDICIKSSIIILVLSSTDIKAQKIFCTSYIENQPTPLTITKQPTFQIRCLGSGALFSVTVSSTTPCYYQWRKNGDTIPNSNSGTYIIPVITTADQGAYSVTISNFCSSITSNSTDLKVIGTSYENIPNKISAKTRISWNKRSGKKYAVFVKRTTVGAFTPVNNATYFADDIFGGGTQVGTTGWYCVYNDTGTSVIVKGLLQTNIYCALLTEYTGTMGNEQYEPIITGSCNPLTFTTLYYVPSDQANYLNFSGINSNSFTVSWTNGNGPNRAVFVKEGKIGSACPVNNTTYSQNSTFGLGTQIDSTGWYCVYNGSGNSVAINNLISNKVYRVMVCEYNGTAGKQQYNSDIASDNPINVTTRLVTPSICIVSVDTITCKNTIVWEKPKVQGNISGFKILKDTFLNTYIEIGTIPFNDSPQFTDLGSLPESHADKYKIIIFDSVNNVSNQSFYHKTMNLTLNRSLNKIRLNWNAYEDESGIFNPMKYYIFRGTQPNNPQLFDSLPSSFTFYYDNDTLSVYYYRIAVTKEGACLDYSGSNNTWSFSNIKDNSSYITLSKPSIQAKNINFFNITSNSTSYKFTRGNGSACVVFLTDGVSPFPPLLDSTTYAVSLQIGISGWYCKYNGSNNFENLTGLNQGNFRMMICEYNGVAGFEKYNTDPATNNPNTFTTVGINDSRPEKIAVYPNPFTQSTTISFPNEGKQPYYLKIFDLSGKMVRNIQNIKDSQVIITKGDLSAGLYYFELVGNEIFRGRFVVE